MQDAWDMQRRRSMCVMQTIALLMAVEHDMANTTYWSALYTFCNKVMQGTCRVLRKSPNAASPCLELLDSYVGECLAALPDEARTNADFAQVVQVALQLLKIGLKHHPGDVVILRVVRRTLAALPPTVPYEGPAIQALQAMVEDVALWLQRLVLHSRFDTVVQHRSLLRSDVPWSGQLNLPITTLMPLVGSEGEVDACSMTSDSGDDLKAEWLTMLEVLLDFVGMFRSQLRADTLGEVGEHLRRIIPSLLGAYSGTLSRDDCASLSLCLAIEMFVHSTATCQPEAPQGHDFGVSCMLHGLIAKQGYVRLL